MDYDNDTVDGTTGSETQLELVALDDISTESSSSEEFSDDDYCHQLNSCAIPTTPFCNDVVVEETNVKRSRKSTKGLIGSSIFFLLFDMPRRFAQIHCLYVTLIVNKIQNLQISSKQLLHGKLLRIYVSFYTPIRFDLFAKN